MCCRHTVTDAGRDVPLLPAAQRQPVRDVLPRIAALLFFASHSNTCCGPLTSMQSTDEHARIMTSAIPSMTVAEVRRALADLRAAWRAHDPAAPFSITREVTEDITYAEFALMFVMGHHRKRHQKSRSSTASPSAPAPP